MNQPADSLRSLLGSDGVLDESRFGPYARDATELHGLSGKPDAVILPKDEQEVVASVAWCYEREIPIVPRGGGTGFAGGAVPVKGGVVLSLERMNRILTFDPEQWRIRVEAGVTTEMVQSTARSHGLLFPPDPGASEQSQIGGNIACNAGGPRCFKYGTTGHWVTGLDAVIAYGQKIRAGGALRKDVAGYDVRSLFTGSEGTLGVITSAWLRLIPAPDSERYLCATYPSLDVGAERVLDVYRSGVVPAAIEFFDAGTLEHLRKAFPGGLPDETEVLILIELDGTQAAVDEATSWVTTVLEPDNLGLGRFSTRGELEAIRRWRSGASYAVAGSRGGKLSEDVVVPVECLAQVIRATEEIGQKFELPACSWGHGGDGNLHATFLLDPSSVQQVSAARDAARELFVRVRELGGSVTGEHGMGWVKREEFTKQFTRQEVALQRSIKLAFDPLDLFNPGKKVHTGG